MGSVLLLPGHQVDGAGPLELRASVAAMDLVKDCFWMPITKA